MSLWSPKNTNTVAQQAKIDFKSKENISLLAGKCLNQQQQQHHCAIASSKRKPLSPVKIEESDSCERAIVKCRKNEEREEEGGEKIDFEIDEKQNSLHERKPTNSEKTLFYIEDDGNESNERSSKEDLKILCENTFTDDDNDSDSEVSKKPSVYSELNDNFSSAISESDSNPTRHPVSNFSSALDAKAEVEQKSSPSMIASKSPSSEPCKEIQDCVVEPLDGNVNVHRSSLQEEGATPATANNKHKLKIGLNKRHCNGRGVSSFLRRPSPSKSNDNSDSQTQNKITQMLDKFKNIPSTSAVFSSSVEDLTNCSVGDAASRVDLREEGLLTPIRSSSSATSVKTTKVGNCNNTSSIINPLVEKRLLIFTRCKY